MDQEGYVSVKVDPKGYETEDLFDSDNDPEFDVREFKERNIDNLSDSEKEALDIEVARKKRKEKQVHKEKENRGKACLPCPSS